MKKKGRKKTEGRIEPFIISWETLFNPTIEMAAELINAPVCIVEEWLVQGSFSITDGILSSKAIDFLAKKYVTRLHRYFDNCIQNWKSLDADEQKLFNEFRFKYSKLFVIRATKWNDIDHRCIERDFKNELNNKAREAFFEGFDNPNFPGVFEVLKSNDVYSVSDIECCRVKSDAKLLYCISHSFYYISKRKTAIPARPGFRNMVLEILIENRFHIFSGESDSNVLIDVCLSTYVKQPLLAIADVFGYTRHKNTTSHDQFKKEKAYCCR